MTPRYNANRDQSLFVWLKGAWNSETGYEHGPLVPLVAIGLIIFNFKALRASVGKGSNWGLASVFIGALLYTVAYRTLQPRIAGGALPFVLWGCGLYFWGWRTSRLLLFPLFFLWLAVPLPSFQQATTQLQMLATSLAHHGSSLFGVETYTEGSKVLPVKGNWEPLDIAGGCSGIRSLMALIMVSAAWAYVAKMAFWKRGVLFFMAFPLAIIGNALRVISIFVIAEYGDAQWARTTWHDWSGLLLFYPFSLLSLFAVHSLLEGGLPWKQKGGKKVLRRVVIKNEQAPNSNLTEA
ncbi:exosortase/archaeosortase family protein [Luteolibacter pohnpeiensis]|uniref:Exosortase/archaeosortase family protein n=1 Tax=Luteolibacter pohnpeiensis TaxID=454153 RepID=A0A934SA76_9BACT|nr:exosortase/archaeosortase family protein [Luteolibacter pohnpeiensis]MBK1882492.1 exosortase/archaeosortase family protein [Luteolibacter pohnpeiensis]